MKKKSGLRVIVLGIVALAVIAGLAIWLMPKGKEKPINVAGNVPAGQEAWVVRCQPLKNKNYCETYQRIDIKKKDQAQSQRLIEVAVGYPPDKKGKARGIMVLPLGILLQGPLTMQVDNQSPVAFQVRFCQQSGCYAFLDLPDSEVEKMQKGQKLTIKAAVPNRDMNFVLSLKGFGQALAKANSSS